MHEYRNYSDPLSAFDAYEADMYAFERSRPVCHECGEHILDDYAYYLGDNWYCPDCVERNYRSIK